ncbi:O-antigen ligase family protein [Ancylobacter sp. IITR112]|uniref:O-antigen ligase family protein n=1 Tax=Ancylobacter sp. IITR112 TaxID=3138073 RepID=UPI003529F83E
MALFLKPHGDGGAAFVASVLLLFANVVLGGATRTGYLADVLLQALSLPFLALAVWLWLDRLTARRPAWSFGLVCGAALAATGLVIALAQFLPLFGAPGWEGISARIVAAGGQGLDGVAWTGSSSVDPAASLAALPAVLPPLALFLLVALLDEEGRLRFAGWAVVIGLVALLLGILQVMQGPASGLRFFEISNRSESVGFFANRNHFAAQLYVTFLLAVAWFVGRGDRVLGHRGASTPKVIWLAAAFSLGVLVLAGIALARSRAGILLLLVALAGVVVMAPLILSVLRGRGAAPHRVRSLVLAVLVGVVLLVGQLGADRFLGRFGGGLVDQLRAVLNETTFQAAREALPFGTGLGTFTAVFPVYEGPATLSPQYVNRAHDDWLEFFLETGLPGMVLVACFLAWFGERIYRLWIASGATGGLRLLVLQQCASLAVLLLMLHSLVDYPLRTAAMFAYFAACCALMTPGAAAARLARDTRAPAAAPPPRQSRRPARTSTAGGRT